jgi:hypothetical protein
MTSIVVDILNKQIIFLITTVIAVVLLHLMHCGTKQRCGWDVIVM